MNRSYHSQLHISTDQNNLTEVSYIKNYQTQSQLVTTSKETLPGIISFLLMCIENTELYSIRIPESLVYLPYKKVLYLVYTDNLGKIIVDSGPSVLYKFFDIIESKTDRKEQYYHVAKGYSRNYNHKALAIDNWKSFENKGEIHAILKNFNISRVSYWIRTVYHIDSSIDHFKIIQGKKSFQTKHRRMNSLFKQNTTDYNYAGRLQRTSFFPSLPIKSSLTFCKDSCTKRNGSFTKHTRTSSHKKLLIPQQSELLQISNKSEVHLIYPTRKNSPTTSKNSLFIQPIREDRKVSEIENMTIELSRVINSFFVKREIEFRASFIKDECDRWCLYSVKSAEFTAESILAESCTDKTAGLVEALFSDYQETSDSKLKLDFKKSRLSTNNESFSKTRPDRVLKLAQNAVKAHKFLDLRDSIEKSKQIYLTNFSKTHLPKRPEVKEDIIYGSHIDNIIHKFDSTMIHARECLEHFTIAYNLQSYSIKSDSDILNRLSRDHYTYVIEHPKLAKYFKSRCVSYERIVNHGFIRAFKQPITDKFKENLTKIHTGLKVKYSDFDLYMKIFIGVMKKYRILKSDRERMYKRLWIYSSNIIEIYDTPVPE